MMAYEAAGVTDFFGERLYILQIYLFVYFWTVCIVLHNDFLNIMKTDKIPVI